MVKTLPRIIGDFLINKEESKDNVQLIENEIRNEEVRPTIKRNMSEKDNEDSTSVDK